MLAVPRSWTPPFALISADAPRDALSAASRVRALVEGGGQLVVRSSVLGESIWDRGRYRSVNCDATAVGFEERLNNAIDEVVQSASGKAVALLVQRFVKPLARGEFGNLLRISKTRDHWELSTEMGEARSTVKFNTQRDEAASPDAPLRNRPSISRERLFGSVAAWLNNNLVRGRRQRLNCEWVADSENLFIVQLDEEDEDFVGANPFQIRVLPRHRPAAAKGTFLAHAEGDALQSWDKLKVLEELWEPDATQKPTLFFVPLVDLQGEDVQQRLEDDFRNLVGPANVVVRTSVRAGKEKPPNLPRTEGVNPDRAAAWCMEERDRYQAQGVSLNDLAFVTHHFVPARASAWSRAEPGNPVVEIHSLWGLPDGLQSCPYDIWEVHVPTDFATEYPDYKSNMLVARDDGGWEYVRIKNELARNLSVTQREALDIARRTLAITERLAKPCHIMWFVGCVDGEGIRFNLPWYWTKAHETEQNADRTNYETIIVSDPESLDAFKKIAGSRLRQAIQFQPVTQDLMHNFKFIESVGAAAKAMGMPVIYHGSTLAHAYYQLTRTGCTVVTPGEKEHIRVRRSAIFGKLVRDKIPDRIAARRESEATLKLPSEVVVGFLIGKLIEEAMEVRHAETADDKAGELADLYEVVRALAHAAKVPIKDIIERANEKRQKAGGFDAGIVLLQTGIRGRYQRPSRKPGKTSRMGEQGSQVLARKIAEDTYEIPFSFFGFMENGLTRSLMLEGVNARLDVMLLTDRITISIAKNAEQLEFPLDLTVSPTG
ncbi:MAG TPA: nucleoside triphosphate pyrophosphohydrolase [Xanthobacteraceae bacterium]|nr:nucleoside triphosphate pyrophosphohydrolase [Xanthobacteraceae bacterium]